MLRKIYLNDDQTMEIPKKENSYSYTIGNERSQGELLIDFTNQRLRVLEIKGNVIKDLLDKIFRVAKLNKLSKIWVVANQEQWMELLNWGYTLEGILPKFYEKNKDAYYMAYYTDQKRAISDRIELEDDLIRNLNNLDKNFSLPILASQYQMREATLEDSRALAKFYGRIFPTYPTPMDEPLYVEKMMKNKVIFNIILSKGEIIAAASADIDEPSKSVEMTDIACDPEHRGQQIPVILVAKLEEKMKELEMITLYSLARARLPGINKLFYNLGYIYYGRLLNNCDICDSFEDMNILAKTLK